MKIKSLLLCILTIVLTAGSIQASDFFVDSNENYGTTWYSTWKNTSNMQYSWNIGTNIIVASQNAGLVCCDYGLNINSGNDYVYSYCLDKYEKHVSNMKQVNRGDYWFYSTTPEGDSYTTSRYLSYETYGTSLVKRANLY